MTALKQLSHEAIISLWRRRRSAALSVATIAVALFVLGAFLLLTSNLEHLVAGWGNAAEISVYLRDDISEQQRAAIDQSLKSSPLIAGYSYVSKQQALERFRGDFADLVDVATSLIQNPFPASFEAQLSSPDANHTGLNSLVTGLQGSAGVADVRYDRRWIDRLLAAVSLARSAGIFFGGVLVVAAALTVANVVRLAVEARREEVEIMQLVGAPLMWVRGAFIMEGVLQGGAGALLALVLLWSGFITIRNWYGRSAAEILGLTTLRFIPWEFTLGLLVGGMLVGCIGAFVAVRNAI